MARKGSTVVVIAVLAIVGFFVVPRLPTLFIYAGIDSMAGIHALETGTPRISGVQISGDDGLVFDVTVPLSNPNDFDIKVDRLSYRVSVNDRFIGSGKTDVTYTVPAMGETTVEEQFDVTAAGTIDAGIDSIMNQLSGEENTVTVKGTIHTAIGPFQMDLPYEKTAPF